jgi:hypothetical protein
MGLSNALCHAKAENNLKRRDDLLQELRALAYAHPAEAAVREQLAKGLFNTLIDAKEENDTKRQDDLLKELQSLSEKFPDDPSVKDAFDSGLKLAPGETS